MTGRDKRSRLLQGSFITHIKSFMMRAPGLRKWSDLVSENIGGATFALMACLLTTFCLKDNSCIQGTIALKVHNVSFSFLRNDSLV